MVRTNQGGSIVGFVVIGAVLILGSASLLYWVSHRSAAPTQTPEVSVPAASEKPTSDDTDETKTESPTDTDSDVNKENTDSTQADGSQSEPKSDPSGQVVEQIPQTGPADTLVQILVIGLLAGVVTSFIRSNKRRSTL